MIDWENFTAYWNTRRPHPRGKPSKSSPLPLRGGAHEPAPAADVWESLGSIGRTSRPVGMPGGAPHCVLILEGEKKAPEEEAQCVVAGAA